MALSKESVLDALRKVAIEPGQDPVSRGLIHALAVDGGVVRFVLEGAPLSELTALKPRVEAAVTALPEVVSVVAVIPAGDAPRIGGHPQQQQGPQAVKGVKHIIAVGSGKGGVGKSTVSANLAVALSRAGKKVGLLDADFYGPSQPKMMGINRRPASPDGKTILPLQAHGLTLMSIGFMLKEEEAIIWRGPMLMGALQQMLGQVVWDYYGDLDVLIIDLPPGTGDIQLSLTQKAKVDGAIVVSTPQDIAMLDARKALDMFRRLNTPVIGMIENMSTYVCPNCGHEAHLFGHGGVETEAKRLAMPFLGALPLDLEVRVSGDAGTPAALGDGPAAKAYAEVAARLIAAGHV